MRYFYRLALILILVAIPIFTMAVADSGGAGGGPLPVPTPMPDGVRVTAEMTIRRCLTYNRYVLMWMDKLDFDYPPELILSIMAKESSCDPDATDGESVGLMQVTPRPWTRSRKALSGVSENIRQGMWLFNGCLELSGGDVELALAYYNCGVPKVEENACGRRGGIHYATDVLSFWLPLFSQ